MSYPRVQTLMEEYGLEVDDIRWYLAGHIAYDVLSIQNEPRKLVEMIWSGKLGDRLYQFEERYLDELERQWTSGEREEARVREILAEARTAKRRRR